MNSLLSRCEGTSWEVADKADVVRGREHVAERIDAGRDWGQKEKGMTENERAGWHH